MALREFTLSNMMIWGASAMLAVGGAGAGSAVWLGTRETAPVIALAAPPLATPSTHEVMPPLPAPPLPAPARAELPKLRLATAKARPAARASSHVARQIARAHGPAYASSPSLSSAPSYAPPNYAPPARWQRAYVAAQYPMPYYAYAPRYGEYVPYPGY